MVYRLTLDVRARNQHRRSAPMYGMAATVFPGVGLESDRSSLRWPQRRTKRRCIGYRISIEEREASSVIGRCGECKALMLTLDQSRPPQEIEIAKQLPSGSNDHRCRPNSPANTPPITAGGNDAYSHSAQQPNAGGLAAFSGVACQDDHPNFEKSIDAPRHIRVIAKRHIARYLQRVK